ncbi:LysR substrate-binding domain-containing protein [Haliea sp. E17]|uniref:LysR substrate-binding domain-containing protein n=1 Tax=Haliea sp. E17 TaxID=3401576 RepID=UPI003AAA361D
MALVGTIPAGTLHHEPSGIVARKTRSPQIAQRRNCRCGLPAPRDERIQADAGRQQLSHPGAPCRTIESNEAIKHAVMSGLGVSILSEHTLTFGGAEGLARVEVQHLPIESTWYLVRPRSRRLSLISRAFLDYLERDGGRSLAAPE